MSPKPRGPHSAVAVCDPASVMEVAFVRRRGSRDRVYVTRGDGTSTGWDFPSYGDWLPHDLCHLVVEEELRLKDGFWGLVDRGVEVGLVNNQATLIRDGKPLVEHPEVNLTGLMEAEAAVAALSGPAGSMLHRSAGSCARRQAAMDVRSYERTRSRRRRSSAASRAVSRSPRWRRMLAR